MDGQSIDTDQFRIMEKRIKRFCKELVTDRSKLSKRQRQKLDEGRPAAERAFSWDEVVDVTCPSSSSRFRLASDSQQLAHPKTVLNLSLISPGLYLISQALDSHEQLHWAAKAVEEYSTVEHNNLTNLSSLYGMNSQPSDEVKEAGGESHGAPSRRSAILDVATLWQGTAHEVVPFQTFSKLRWSCLGYHYGMFLLYKKYNLVLNIDSDDDFVLQIGRSECTKEI
jgi:hypothetical protein